MKLVELTRLVKTLEGCQKALDEFVTKYPAYHWENIKSCDIAISVLLDALEGLSIHISCDQNRNMSQY